MNNDLEYSLGLNISGFQKSARQAIDATEGLKRQVKSIGDVITAGGVSTVAIGFLRDMADWAERSGDKLNENVLALRRWKSAFEDRDGLRSGAAALLAPFIQGGETIGLTLRAIGEGVRKNLGADLVTLAKGVADEWTRAVDAHTKDLELTKEELSVGADRKKQLQEQANLRERLTKESDQLAERERQARLGQLTAQERVNAISNEVLEKEREIANIGENELKRKELDNQRRRLALELLDAQKTLQRENAAAADAAAKAEKEKADAAARAAIELEKQLQLQQEAAGNVARANAAAADMGFAGLSQSEADALSAWVKGGKKGPAPAISRSPDVARMLGGMQLTEFGGVALGPVRSRADFQGVSDQVVQELIRRYNQQLLQVDLAPFMGGPEVASRSYVRGLARSQIESNRAFAQDELRARSSLRGEDFSTALRGYAGDPLNFDRLYAAANNQLSEQQKTNAELRELNKTLRSAPGVTVLNARNLPGKG